MKQEAKTLIILGVITVIMMIGGAFLLSKSSTNKIGSEANNPALLVRDNSNKVESENASVTLVEFGDYQCPACAAAHPTVKQILDQYKGKITFVFRHFPLPSHNHAMIAAEAVEAAGDQGKYWEMHNKVYEGQKTWSNQSSPLETFIVYAQELGLDEAKFKDAVDSNKFEDKIRADLDDGQKLGVNSTPTFYLNGEKITDLPTFSDLKSRIDSLLGK